MRLNAERGWAALYILGLLGLLLYAAWQLAFRQPVHTGLLTLLPADSASPESETLAAHMLGVVTEELGKMSEKNRSAYVLLKEEDMSAGDAAILLGTTTNVVKQRAHRAYEQLRAALHAAGWREHGDHA